MYGWGVVRSSILEIVVDDENSLGNPFPGSVPTGGLKQEAAMEQKYLVGGLVAMFFLFHILGC